MNRARLTIFVTFVSLSALLLIWSFTPLATARFEEDEGIDPDRLACAAADHRTVQSSLLSTRRLALQTFHEGA